MKTAVVYATDENYVKLTAVSICSLLTYNPGERIVVLSDNVSSRNRAVLADLAARRNAPLAIIDVSGELSQIKNTGAGEYVSFSAYSRLFIPALLKDDVERAIYIDGDTLVAGSLGPLFHLDLSGKAFAIGYDCIFNRYKQIIGIPPTAPYFNTGVLLMDLAKWRQRRCSERIFDYMKNVRHDFMFGDQDYFALVLAQDSTVLPPAYNFLPHFQMFRRRKDVLTATGIPAGAWYGEEQYAAAQANPVIHHFLGHTLGRPWYRESLNPLRETYRRFAAAAGVPEVAEQSRPIESCYRVQHLCWRCLPQPLFAIAVRAMYSYFFRTRYGV